MKDFGWKKEPCPVHAQKEKQTKEKNLPHWSAADVCENSGSPEIEIDYSIRLCDW